MSDLPYDLSVTYKDFFQHILLPLLYSNWTFSFDTQYKPPVPYTHTSLANADAYATAPLLCANHLCEGLLVLTVLEGIDKGVDDRRGPGED